MIQFFAGANLCIYFMSDKISWDGQAKADNDASGDGGDGYFGSQFQNIDRFAAGVVGSRDSEKKGTHFVTRQVENRQSNRIAEPNSDGGGSFTGSQDKSRGNGIAV